MIITDFDTLCSEADGIQSYLLITMSNQPEEAVERLTTLMVYLARANKMYADARYHLNIAIQSHGEDVLGKLASGMLSKKAQDLYIRSMCEKEQQLADYIYGISNSCKHQIEVTRSLLSLYKTEMQMEMQTPRI